MRRRAARCPSLWLRAGQERNTHLACAAPARADVEFGRIQARDLLQHLLTGPISNAPVDIVRVRPLWIADLTGPGCCPRLGCRASVWHASVWHASVWRAAVRPVSAEGGACRPGSLPNAKPLAPPLLHIIRVHFSLCSHAAQPDALLGHAPDQATLLLWLFPGWLAPAVAGQQERGGAAGGREQGRLHGAHTQLHGGPR